jgi:putative isomerase
LGADIDRLIRMRICAVGLGLLVCVAAQAGSSAEYGAVQKRLARGWNTWDVRSVAAQVLLPEGFTIRVGLKHRSSENSEAFLADPLIGRQGKGVESVFPEARTWNGSYTSVRVSWRGHEFRLETGHAGEDLVMLATPLGAGGKIAPALVISAGILWNRAGSVLKEGSTIAFRAPGRKVTAYWTGTEVSGYDAPVSGPYWAASFTAPVGVSTGKARSVEEIRAILAAEKPAEAGDVKQAIETVLGWDTIYEPSQGRVITPVSRLWSVGWGGYVLFDWDTFFAASLAAVVDRDLAYANAVEILREATPEGFVPNYARAEGWKSFDRSEPPVGAITVLALYRRFHDQWLVRDTFERLLAWNRWWAAHRDVDGFLVWGTDAGNAPGNPDDRTVGKLQAAKFESGLDNSPMYDEAPFSAATGSMELADAGLIRMYVADCDALAEMAQGLGKEAEAGELRGRADKYRKQIQKLWDEKTGMFLNKDLRTGRFSYRMSPTNFYPMLAKAATAGQAEKMVKEHLLNPGEFWGEWVIPSISRSDPAFQDQQYWRGRIWGPMNYLVYLGLRNYDVPEVRREFASKSLDLFEREWREKGHVHENYNAMTGEGDDVRSSDRFYHWGVLLGLIEYMEGGEAGKRPRQRTSSSGARGLAQSAW